MKEPKYICHKCGENSEEQNFDIWYDHEDGMTYHLVDRDTGGGNSSVEACGPVVTEG